MLRKISCTLVVLMALAAAAYAYEIPVSRLGSWELAFNSNPPRVMSVVESTESVEYTYIIYTIANDTAQKIDFYPIISIEGENGKVFSAGVYPAVEAVIKKRFGKNILGFTDIVGEINPGETKKGVAIFKSLDPAADKLIVYVGGISGDFKKASSEEGAVVTMYRTYKLLYKRPGDQWNVEVDPVTLQATEWIWRE